MVVEHLLSSKQLIQNWKEVSIVLTVHYKVPVVIFLGGFNKKVHFTSQFHVQLAINLQASFPPFLMDDDERCNKSKSKR